MSSTLKFMDNFKKFRKDVIELEKLAESHRLEKFIAARKIQSLFRGFITRKHIKMLHAKATIIQASWRGYVGRLFCNEFIIKRAYDMWNEHYNVMATKIQAVWRGYYSRKTKKDFIKIKKWLKDVTTKNEDMLQNMKEFRRIEIENTIQMLEQESMLKILFILFKIHHLLGTVSQPGVFTRIDKVQCTHIEKMIKCLKYRYYKVQRKKEKKPRVFIFRGTYLEKCEREIREYEDSLRAKDAPINRGCPYEEQNKPSQIIDNLIIELFHQEKQLETKQFDEFIKCNDKKSSSLILSYSNDIYELVLKMKCDFGEMNIKCPIHLNK